MPARSVFAQFVTTRNQLETSGGPLAQKIERRRHEQCLSAAECRSRASKVYVINVGPRSARCWAHRASSIGSAQLACSRSGSEFAPGGVIEPSTPQVVPQSGCSIEQLRNLPAPESMQASYEEFNAWFEANEEIPNSWPVEEVLPLSDEGIALVGQLVKERRLRCHLSLPILKAWLAYESVGLPWQFLQRWTRAPRVVRLQNPSPEDLFPYVLRNQPVIISGALNEQNFPPLREFNDFDYLRARCGERIIKLKADHYMDRECRSFYVTDPSLETEFAEWLHMVEEAERWETDPGCYMGKTRLQDVLPEMVEDLVDVSNSPGSPIKQFGKCFGPNPKGTHMYFGCGFNSTAIHTDPSENLLVVVSGTKRFDLYPPTDVDCLYPVKAPSFLNAGVLPFIDPDAMTQEQLERWPLYRYADVQTVHLEAGDMLYLPLFWWHGVTGGIGRNMILSWWQSMHPIKEPPHGAHWRIHGTPDPSLVEGAHAIVLDSMNQDPDNFEAE